MADFETPPAVVERITLPPVRVVGIRAYRRDIEALDHGMTAEITVTGTGIRMVAPDHFLEGTGA